MKTTDKIVYILINIIWLGVPYFITIIAKRCAEKIKEK